MVDNLCGLLQNIASTNLAAPTRQAIINRVFGLQLNEQEFLSRDNGFSAYFNDWYEEQCEAAAGEVSVKTHEELLQILAQLQLANESRGQVLNKLSPPSIGPLLVDQCLNASITLAARVWLAISIDSSQHFLTPGHLVAWDNGSDDGKLSQAVHDALWSNTPTAEKVKLSKVFTAANLEKIAGIEVQWTSNLADHLSLRDDDTKVMLFHQASFLELHKLSKKFV